MKRIFTCLSLLLCIIIFSSCQSKNVLKPDTPENTVWLFKRAIDDGKYDDLNKLFVEERKNTLSMNTIKKLKGISTPGAGFKHYQLLTFTNGEMVLIRLTPQKVDGEYRIEDVIIVPEEAKKLFMEEK